MHALARITFVDDDSVVAQNGADKEIIARFEITLICISTKSQRRELLPQYKAGQAAQDAQWRQGRTRPGRENYPGRGISERRRDETTPGRVQPDQR